MLIGGKQLPTGHILIPKRGAVINPLHLLGNSFVEVIQHVKSATRQPADDPVFHNLHTGFHTTFMLRLGRWGGKGCGCVVCQKRLILRVNPTNPPFTGYFHGCCGCVIRNDDLCNPIKILKRQPMSLMPTVLGLIPPRSGENHPRIRQRSHKNTGRPPTTSNRVNNRDLRT